MKNNEHEILQAAGYDESEFSKFDFEFKRKDSSEKIHDEKFQYKPTTFARDALRRFVKNKASVVGAVIIGVLLLGSFLSFLSPFDISSPAPTIAKMVPKIRAASNGFWDGTMEFHGAVYDPNTQTPLDVEEKNIVPGTLKIDPEVTYFDNEPKPNASGGYYRPQAESYGDGTLFLRNYSDRKYRLDLVPSDDLKIKITVGGIDGVQNGKLAPFDLTLIGYSDYDMGEKIAPITLATNVISPDGNDYVLEVNDAATKMEAAGVNKIEFAQLQLGFAQSQTDYTYILVRSIELSSSETSSDAVKKRLAEMSFNDANWVCLNATKESYTERYWQSNGKRLVYHAELHYCSYRKDQYEEVLGLRSDIVIGGTILKQYIDNGWCTMEDFTDPSTFVLANPDSNECPLRSIDNVEIEGTGENAVYQFHGKVLYYRYLGFNSMPYFIFGTDSKGYDMLTLSMSCLKNSLLLAIVTSAICLAIGLVWGSFSGYFGGNVDLVMERITDILSGVPWIVVMTLVMVLLGQGIVTFGFAIVLTGWIGTASRTRTQFYRFKGREYVLASRTLGASDTRLIFRHILPNGLGTIVTGSVLMIPSNIFSEASLSYLGLGLKGTASFGVVLSENQAFLSSRPMLIIWPSIIISLLMISFNLFGNGLRDALNPSLKGGEQ